MTTVAKTSISLKKHNREKLSDVKNRSVIINQALDLYFERQSFMQQAEQKWLEQSITSWLQDIQRGDVIILNQDWKKRTKKEIADFLNYSKFE